METTSSATDARKMDPSAAESDGDRTNSSSTSPTAVRETSTTAARHPRGESKSQDSVLGSGGVGLRSRGGSGGIGAPSGGLSVPFGTPDFPSLSSTPNSISQLLANFPSSALTLEGLDYQSPLGSGIISPLTAAGPGKLGQKRPISISPLSSTSQLELNSFMRASPSSLVNCISSSRGDSANSIGHLSPSLANSMASPHKTPLFSLRTAAHPPPLSITASFPLNTAVTGRSPEHRGNRDTTNHISSSSIKQEPLEDMGGGSQPGRNDPHLQFNTNSQESGFNSQPRELETLHEEDDLFSDDEMQTDPSNSDCSSRYTGEGGSQDSKQGIIERKPRRVNIIYLLCLSPYSTSPL